MREIREDPVKQFLFKWLFLFASVTVVLVALLLKLLNPQPAQVSQATAKPQTELERLQEYIKTTPFQPEEKFELVIRWNGTVIPHTTTSWVAVKRIRDGKIFLAIIGHLYGHLYQPGQEVKLVSVKALENETCSGSIPICYSSFLAIESR